MRNTLNYATFTISLIKSHGYIIGEHNYFKSYFIQLFYQFVKTDLRINYSLQTQLVAQTPPRLAKSLFSSVFELKGFLSVTGNTYKQHCS